MKIGSEYGGSSGYDPATDAMSHMTVDDIWNGYRGYVVGLSLGNKFTGEHEELVKGAFERYRHTTRFTQEQLARVLYITLSNAKHKCIEWKKPIVRYI